MGFVAKEDLQNLSRMRLEDAKILLEGERFSACYYLCGYAVEMALKAVIAKNFHQNVIPDKRFVNDIYIYSSTEGTRVVYPGS